MIVSLKEKYVQNLNSNIMDAYAWC